MKIDTIIFDFGGVILTSAQEEAVRRFNELGVSPEVLPLDKYTQTGLIGDLEEGKITAEEFRDSLNERVGRNNTLDDYQWAITGYAKEVPERNLRLLRQLRQDGFRLLLLSNTNPYMMAWALSPDFDGEGRALSDYLDECYCSYKIGSMKPSPEIFRYVIEHENLDPAKAVFVDDNRNNVMTAQQLGMHILQPVNGEDWTGDLIRMIEKLN